MTLSRNTTTKLHGMVYGCNFWCLGVENVAWKTSKEATCECDISYSVTFTPTEDVCVFSFYMRNPTCLSLWYFSQNCSDFNFVLSRYQTPRNSQNTHQDLKTHKTSRCAVYLKPFKVFRNRWVNPIKSLTKRPGKIHLPNTQTLGGLLKWSLQSSRVSPAPRLSRCRFNGHWDGSGGTNILDHWNILVFVLRPVLLKCTLYTYRS